MRALLDINIWIDIAVRPKTYPTSAELYKSLEVGGHAICLPMSGYTTLYYLLSQLINREAAMEYVATLSKRGVCFLPFSQKELLLAHKLSFKDHEDACVAAIALNGDCDYIIARNVKDYTKSPVQAISPDSALKKLI